MRGMVRRFGHGGGFVSAALALLLLLRILIPSGYMIAPDQQGRLGLALCAAPARAAAEAELHGGHDGHPVDDSAPSKPGEIPCPFAAAAAAPLLPDPPAVAPRGPFVAISPDLPEPAGFPRVARAAPRPPARGPPPSV